MRHFLSPNYKPNNAGAGLQALSFLTELIHYKKSFLKVWNAYKYISLLQR
jgi:hypothetical protein